MPQNEQSISGIESIHPLQAYILKAGISGSVCAAVSAALNGVDVTKIRMQNQNSADGLRYTGMVSGMRRIFSEEGFQGLTRGIQASMLREITYSSIRMGAYEPIRALLSDNVDPVESSPIIKLFSALISGGVGSAIANPLDLMKTRFQAVLPGQIPPHTTTFSGLRDVFQQHGMSGLYKGWMVTSARAAVLTSAQLGSYDSIKHNLLVDMLGMKESFSLHLYASMSAGILTTTAANPLDVIKTRYLSDCRGLYSSPWDCIVQTFRAEGVRGFFKGWVPAYWRLGPHTVLSLLIIEHIRTAMGLHNI